MSEHHMSDNHDDYLVVMNDGQHRFEVKTETGVGFLQYYLTEDSIVFTHTEVPQELSGHGIGGSLVRAGLEYARREGLAVVPLCPFVEDYLRRHPRDLELVEATYREGMTD